MIYAYIHIQSDTVLTSKCIQIESDIWLGNWYEHFIFDIQIEVEIVLWISFDITLLNEGNIGHKSEDSLWDTNILDLKVESEVYN